MAVETEIKLRINKATLAALRQESLFNQASTAQWRELELQNTYFDNQDFALAKARVALRVRRDGEQLIQTLKTKGCSVAGLSERNEWDWEISQPQLDLELLNGDCWPQQLQDLDKSSLQAIFTTDFTRQALEVVVDDCTIEVALDLGSVSAGQATEEICELELELRNGEPQQLLQMALQLAQKYPLMPCDISKAERGYRLLLPGSFDLQVMPAQLTAQSDMDTVTASLAAQLLSASQRLAEQYLYSGNWKLLERWVENLLWLRALLSSLGQIVPRKSSSKIRQLLDELLADWLADYVARSEPNIREAAKEKFALEMQQTRWGQLSLQLALWLQQNSWTWQRNQVAQRQAKAELQRWLQRWLREELAKLPLQQSAEVLVQQQERLERILFWLEHARHTLTQYQLDELLGRLRKLHNAVLQRNDGELRQQANMLWQDPTLRQLLKG